MLPRTGLSTDKRYDSPVERQKSAIYMQNSYDGDRRLAFTTGRTVHDEVERSKQKVRHF
jgi:hypothetical protein